MLVLTRGVGETICIAEGTIRVTVKRIGRSKVELKIEAPRDIPVLRSEIAGTKPERGERNG